MSEAPQQPATTDHTDGTGGGTGSDRDSGDGGSGGPGGPAGPSRRSLITKGLWGGAILLIGGSVPILFRAGAWPRPSRSPLRVLSPREYETFAAAAARLCPGGDGVADRASGWPSADALGCADKVDDLMALLHPKVAGEFRRLLRVFENGMTGLVCVGVPTTFTRSSPELQDRRLQAWRHSRVALFRSGYQAMKRLAHATYYASPEVYARVGYPGPPIVPRVAG